MRPEQALSAPTEKLPMALAPFLGFAQALRASGFAVAPEQTSAFIAAVGLLGPRNVSDVRRAAHATLGPGPDRQDIFDALFDAIFLGRIFSASAVGADEDMPPAFDAGAPELMPDTGEEEPSGADASQAERLFMRRFENDESAALRAFSRTLPGALPKRRARRMVGGKGREADPRRTFREIMRRDGELSKLPKQTHSTPAQRVVSAGCLRFDEGWNRWRTAHCPRAGSRWGTGRGVYHWYAVDPRDPCPQPPQQGAGTRIGLRACCRLGWRHAAWRCVAGLPRDTALCGLRAGCTGCSIIRRA